MTILSSTTMLVKTFIDQIPVNENIEHNLCRIIREENTSNINIMISSLSKILTPERRERKDAISSFDKRNSSSSRILFRL